MPDITQLNHWQALQTHKNAGTPLLKNLFAQDPERFQRFSIALPGMLIDFSKQPLTEETRKLLVSLAEEAGLSKMRDSFFAGDKVNTTEDRAALHMALRAPAHIHMHADKQNVSTDVHQTLMRMRFLANTVRNGEWRGYSKKPITDIVNIGIGGSTLGPQLVSEALSGYHHPRLKCQYVSNVDASDLARVLKTVSPQTTLFIIASKTFTTVETMQNARIAQDWLLDHFQGDKKAIASHFVAASTNTEAVEAFGIAPENMFSFQDWVGGRYSVWSSIGLSSMIMIGPDRFSEFLTGAYEMDEHFRTAPFTRNMPVMLALIGLWHRNFLNHAAHAIIPYHSTLRRLPAYLQQLDMESNGKSVTRDGKLITVKTAPVIFGEPGTDAQHIFFQWLHQGPDIVPVDFIAAIRTPYDTPEQQQMLLANFLAQSEALMMGRDHVHDLHRHFSGNRPSTTILFDELDPRSIGMLLALYEHKIFTQGVLWGINSFDQWGVGLGKDLAKNLEHELKSGMPGLHDGSTLALLEYITHHIHQNTLKSLEGNRHPHRLQHSTA